MKQRARYAIALAMAMTTLFVGVAIAHPTNGLPGRQQDDFEGEGVQSNIAKQVEGTERGSLPAVADNVALVGRAGITNPADPTDEGRQGRITDVFGYDHPDAPEGQQSYAYLGAFIEPACEATGVHVMDINDLSAPFEVEDSFISTTPGNYVGEGVQVIRIDDRDVLIFQNETQTTCDRSGGGPFGGISMFDVTDPLNPETITTHVGDTTVDEEADQPDLLTPDSARTVHSFYAWYDEEDDATYAVLVDNEERGSTDVDFMDISDPENPVLINDTLDLQTQFGVAQPSPSNLNEVFSHDFDVRRTADGRYVLLVNYWDGGYVLLDVTDPTPGNISLIQDTDFEEADPERAARGETVSPEGNAHQGELGPEFEYMVNTDEDFFPFRFIVNLEDGTEVQVGQGSDGSEPDQEAGLDVPAEAAAWGGRACDDTDPVTEGAQNPDPDVPSAEETGATFGVVERGVCPFSEKILNVQEAGYDGAIVVNSAAPGNCSGVINMLTPGAITIPSYMVGRDTGFALFGSTDYDEDSCQAGGGPFPVALGETSTQGLSGVSTFEGWGFIRLFQTDLDATGDDQTITESLDTFAVPEAQDPAFADGFGDLSVHEVALDPDAVPGAGSPGLAYSSYYAAGLRVLEYGPDGLEEVGAYIDEDQSNLWGVEVYDRGEDRFILASDRDFGLYIFDYLGDGDAGLRPEPEDLEDDLAPETDTVIRVSGDDRIDTAIEVSQEFYETASAVVLSRSDIFPDSLSGSPLAIDQDAPLLLTGSDGLDDRTAEEIDRVLSPETDTAGTAETAAVYLLGGEEALSAEVEDDVEALGYDVVRYGGRSRYETAAIIAEDGLGSPDTVLLADGNDFPDAVSAGAAGGVADGAVLLTGSESPSDDTDAYLAAGSRSTFAIGGPAAAAYPDAEPLVGETRFETAVEVAETFFETTTVVGLATGGEFADALAGGAAVGNLGGPLLLVGADAPLPDSTGGYLEDNSESIDLAYVFGGVDAISEDVVDEVRAAIADEAVAPPDALQAPPT